MPSTALNPKDEYSQRLARIAATESPEVREAMFASFGEYLERGLSPREAFDHVRAETAPRCTTDRTPIGKPSEISHQGHRMPEHGKR